MAQKKMTQKELKRSKWRSAIKRNERRHECNQSVKSALKTFLKKARLTGGSDSVRQAVKALDKAVERGIIHKNQAARRKSRLMKAINKATSS